VHKTARAFSAQRDSDRLRIAERLPTFRRVAPLPIGVAERGAPKTLSVFVARG